ncbi:MAG: hypothetical protein PHI94_05280 [Eubacteriaceae bacterium]|nr:hypothetical protein [Eubacteriaceae bacterium]
MNKSRVLMKIGGIMMVVLGSMGLLTALITCFGLVNLNSSIRIQLIEVSGLSAINYYGKIIGFLIVNGIEFVFGIILLKTCDPFEYYQRINRTIIGFMLLSFIYMIYDATLIGASGDMMFWLISGIVAPVFVLIGLNNTKEGKTNG